MSEQEEREESKGFKVTDRRSFTSTGERRPDVEASEDEAAPATSSSTSKRPEPEPRAPGPSRSPLSGRDLGFLELLSLLATQASLGLGGAHPVTGESHEDLETARAMISMIEVLKEKTEGNLTPEEQQTLDDVLYQLRMQFVSKAKSKS